MRRSLLALGATVSMTALGLTSAPAAHACGGFFCNNQAIDQSGENIVFVYNDDGTVTTMIQIFYEGPSEEFAWILPVPAEPSVDVGTDAVFRELAARSQPSFITRQEVLGTCRDEPSCPGIYDDLEASDGFRGGADAGAAADAGAPSPGVDVRLRANVGPYDVAVLASGSADALREWLTDNGYVIPDSALAEMDHYVELGHFFVALKLQKDRDSGEIQPIVLTSDNDEPCIPLRLTRIAATPDMPITAYFLGERRVRPMNFMLIEPDYDDSGLWLGGTSYTSYVGGLVDDVGGHGFVTDYAGDAPSIYIEVGDIEDLRAETDPVRFLQTLRDRGFTGDSQLMGLLEHYMPPPEGWDAQTFYNCLFQGWCTSDPDIVAHFEAFPFFPEPLVDALNVGVVAPRAHAQEMVNGATHMTRLFTTMSPDEMDEDPQFIVSEELPREYSNQHQATIQVHCGPEYFRWTAPRDIVLPSGTVEHVADGVEYFGSDREYCVDRGDGFAPWAPREALREIALRRNTRLGGGGLCSVGGAGGLSGVALLFGALLALVWRRRR
ncbi:MAG: DUF2330 domain-containing protein [Myxococcales bacterium]|nr:DUF2330 domain-containing protein [Myxococcales bacterium]